MTKNNITQILSAISQHTDKPSIFELGEPCFWDDPYISKSMLAEHLNQNHDGASRRLKTIEKSVEHLLSSGLLKPKYRVLDLGCGPGLYAHRLYRAGMQVVALDISKRSIDYAVRYAKENRLQIKYRCMNFFDMDYNNEFDVVIQVYGELCTFSDKKRDLLLAKVYKALKKGGLFIFDVSTRAQRMKEGLKNRWYHSEGGFWKPGKHIVLENGYDYPESNVWLDQYIVMDESGVTVYRNWFHDYSLETIKDVLANADFTIIQAWNDLTGNEITDDSDWIAIAAQKKEVK